jgi:hypothetical protein
MPWDAPVITATFLLFMMSAFSRGCTSIVVEPCALFHDRFAPS